MTAAPVPVEIERRVTARLVLRRPVARDLPALVAIGSDPANYEHAPSGAPSRSESEAHAGWMLACWRHGTIGFWVVDHEDQVIGLAGIVPMDFAGAATYNLAFRFIPEARGQGFAAEACREALAVAAALEPARPIVVRTRPANLPARRLSVRLGLERRSELDVDGFVVYASPGARL